mmetsp:Transcript_53328/g.108476  ORF Transcript_53328/g.108476 Transcript_53328/m.108476 type:complete len:101 (-) Transcript_53328:94-396(-)
MEDSPWWLLSLGLNMEPTLDSYGACTVGNVRLPLMLNVFFAWIFGICMDGMKLSRVRGRRMGSLDSPPASSAASVGNATSLEAFGASVSVGKWRGLELSL